MATPTIEAIATQDIAINTDYALEISITGDPEEVTVGGLLEGFGYSWDADNDTLTIAGEATRQLGDAIWVVSAKETPASTAVTREITYNVVSGAPIIEEIGEQFVHKGFESDIFIPVQNRPTLLQADGLLLGLKYEPGSREDPDDSTEMQDGIHITGTVSEGELTVESANLMLRAENDGGTDTYSLPIAIDAAPPGVYLFNDDDSDLYKISFENSLLWTADLPDSGFSSYAPMLAGETAVILFNNSGFNLYGIFHFDGSLAWTYEGVEGSVSQDPVLGGDLIYIVSGGTPERIFAVNQFTGKRHGWLMQVVKIGVDLFLSLLRMRMGSILLTMVLITWKRIVPAMACCGGRMRIQMVVIAPRYWERMVFFFSILVLQRLLRLIRVMVRGNGYQMFWI